jgi:hypothetical protein
MASEVTYPHRPTALRFAGFACGALGAVIAGVGATREWAAVGFVADAERAADVSVHGTDVWDGKVVLFATVVSLLVLLAMRTSGSAATRRGLAIVLIVLGALSSPFRSRVPSVRRTASAVWRAWIVWHGRSPWSSRSR